MSSASSNYIYLDSKDKVSGTNSDFQINVTDLVTNSHKEISIESVILPKSFYAINANNRTFQLTISASSETISLTLGNYTMAQFLTELKTKLDASSLTADIFTVTYSTSTGALTIVSDLNAFTITSGTRNYRYLGLPPSTPQSSTSLSWTSPRVIDIGSTRYLDILLSGVGLASSNTYNANNDVLARVFANVANFETIYYTSGNFDYVSIFGDKLSILRISVVDDFGDVVELNGSDISLVLATRIERVLL